MILTRQLKSFGRKVLEAMGYRLYRPGAYFIFDFESYLYRYLQFKKTLTYLQIGANDGKLNDPMYKFVCKNHAALTGYLLEPLPDVYARLVKNYQDFGRIKTYNLAIHEKESNLTLYRVKPNLEGKLQAFAKGIASYDPNHWRKSKMIPNQDFIEQLKVSACPLSTFILENHIKEVDLIIIDTEGYDYEILKAILLLSVKPKIIRFEHGLRDGIMTSEEFLDICTQLNKSGYQVIPESYDATAFQLNPTELVL
jgi:FkbM family methyltransferase